MPDVGQVTLKLGAETAQFQRATKAAAGQTKKLTADLGTLALKAGTAFAGLSIATNKAFSAARTQVEAQTRLNTAIKATGQAIDPKVITSYAGALQQVTTFGDEATISAAALLANTQLSQEQILALLPAIQDFAAATGQNLDTAARLVGRAVSSGQADLSRYGVTLNDAEKETLKLGDQSQRTALLVDLMGTRFGGTARALAATPFGKQTQAANAFGDAVEEVGKAAAEVFAPLFKTIKKLSEAFVDLDPAVRNTIGITLSVATGLAGFAAATTGIAAVTKGIWGMRTALLATSTAAMKLLAPLLIIPTLIGQVRQIGQIIEDPGAFAAGLQERQGVGEEAGFGEVFAASIKDAFQQGIEPLTSVLDSLTSEMDALPQDLSAAIGVSGGSSEPAVMDFAGQDTEELKDAFADVADEVNESGNVLDFMPELKSGFRVLTDGAIEAAMQMEESAERFAELEEEMEAKNKAEVAKIKERVNQVTDVKNTAVGAAGGIVGSVGAGFMGGGPFGALLAVIGEFIKASEPLMKIFGFITDMFGEIVAAFDPVIEALGPILNLLRDTIGTALRALAPVLKAIGDILRPVLAALLPLAQLLFQLYMMFSGIGIAITVLGPVLEAVAEVVETVAKGLFDAFNAIAEIWNSIVEGIASILRRAGNSLEDAFGRAFGLKNLARQLEVNATIQLQTWEEANSAVSDFTESVEEANSALTNVPEVLKLSALRFRATAGTDATGGQDFGQVQDTGLLAEFNDNSTVTTNVENTITLFNATPEDTGAIIDAATGAEADRAAQVPNDQASTPVEPPIMMTDKERAKAEALAIPKLRIAGL